LEHAQAVAFRHLIMSLWNQTARGFLPSLNLRLPNRVVDVKLCLFCVDDDDDDGAICGCLRVAL
jgi:hypothetical protein